MSEVSNDQNENSNATRDEWKVQSGEPYSQTDEYTNQSKGFQNEMNDWEDHHEVPNEKGEREFWTQQISASNQTKSGDSKDEDQNYNKNREIETSTSKFQNQGNESDNQNQVKRTESQNAGGQGLGAGDQTEGKLSGEHGTGHNSEDQEGSKHDPKQTNGQERQNNQSQSNKEATESQNQNDSPVNQNPANIGRSGKPNQDGTGTSARRQSRNRGRRRRRGSTRQSQSDGISQRPSGGIGSYGQGVGPGNQIQGGRRGSGGQGRNLGTGGQGQGGGSRGRSQGYARASGTVRNVASDGQGQSGKTGNQNQRQVSMEESHEGNRYEQGNGLNQSELRSQTKDVESLYYGNERHTNESDDSEYHSEKSYEGVDVLSVILALFSGSGRFYELHGRLELITEVLPNAPETAFRWTYYNSLGDPSRITFTNLTEKLYNLGYRIEGGAGAGSSGFFRTQYVFVRHR